MILLSFVVLALALFLVVVFLSKPNASSHLLKLSGPRFHRWAINFIFFDGLVPKQFHHGIHKLHEKYGSTFHCRMFRKEFIFTDDLELIKQVFRNRQHFQNASYFRQALANTTGASMFASEGEKWEKKHAILQPMMKLSMIEGNVRQIIQKAIISTEILDKHIGESPRSSIEILHVLRQVTIDVIGEAAFGVDFGSLKNEKPLEGHSFEEVAQTMMNGINKRNNTPELIWNLPTKERKKELAMTQLLKSAFDSLIVNIEEKIQTDPDFNQNANDLVTLICRFRHENPSAKEIYPDQEIFAECFSFLGAGHDTTTYTIFWAIDLISRNSRVYSMVQREVLNLSEKLLSEGRETINSIPIPTHAELESLRFLSAAIKESQRITSFIPGLLREATSDVEVNGLTIPKGFLVLMDVCRIHLSDKYFERATEMIPERWLRSSEVEQMEDQGERLEKISKADPTNFFGFGFGARSCFGRKFALTQIKAVLFVLFQHFHFPTPEQEIDSVFNFGVVPVGKKCDLVYERLSK